jgi:hypothetical protein
MTPTEFIFWLRGFTAGIHHYNISPAQWDYLKDVLLKVKDTSSTK